MTNPGDRTDVSARARRAIGIDIGGTKIAGGLVEGDRLLDWRETPTPAEDPAEILRAVEDLVLELRPSSAEIPVGVAVAGFVDRDRETILFAPNIAWRNVRFRAELSKVLHLPVTLENDANAAAWGEYRFGAGIGCHSIVMVTVGTGIGGGVVAEGHLLTGGHGVAGELGHIRVVPRAQPNGEPPRPCGCGSSGCWEMYGSGTALTLAARALAQTRRGGWLLERAGGDLSQVTGMVVSDAALEGVATACALMDELGYWLGEGLASISAVLDPEVIVVGGGVAAAGEVVLAPLARTYRGVMQHSHRPPAEIRSAALGNHAGMLGAADIAFTRCQDAR